MYELARVREAEGRKAEARQLLAHALRMQPKSFAILFYSERFALQQTQPFHEILEPASARGSICLDEYMQCEVYKVSGISIRNHCRAQPPRDPEPAGLV